MPRSDPDQTRLALAALAACIVQTLGEQDKSFPKRFEANLERIYAHLREFEMEHLGAAETLRLAKEILNDVR